MFQNWDIELFFFLNQSCVSPLMDVLARALQPAWTGIVFGLAVALVILMKGGRRAKVAVLACVLAVVLSDIICAQVLKPLVARPRPCLALEGARLLLGRKSGFGFPSNHAANMMSIACVLGMFFPRWSWPLGGLALFVGFSRVYAGVHYPSDVFGGFMVALVVGTSVVLAAQPFAETWGKEGGPTRSERRTRA